MTTSGTTTITTKPSDLEGWGYGIGSKTMLDKNLYLQVEVNLTDYDAIKGTLSNGNSYTADPKTIAGTVSVGYKF
jgi:opacity protein-like surface antigen